jgi:hypothetical protein
MLLDISMPMKENILHKTAESETLPQELMERRLTTTMEVEQQQILK